MCGATWHLLHSAYDGCRCTPFEFCSGSLNVATPHSDIELQAARRHFFGGIATNCLNNSKSAPLSPSSSPFRTASSSPPIAVSNLAKSKRAVLPWSPNSASRFWLSRQRFDRTSLAYSARRARAREEKRLRAVGGLYRQ